MSSQSVKRDFSPLERSLWELIEKVCAESDDAMSSALRYRSRVIEKALRDGLGWRVTMPVRQNKDPRFVTRG